MNQQLNKRRLSLSNPVSILCIVAIILTATPAYAKSLSISATTVSTDQSYTITHSSISKLQEKVGNGSWTWIESNSGSITFKDKAPNTYYYRTYTSMMCWPVWRCPSPYSATKSVKVYKGEAPALDALDKQEQYKFETRVGDINNDGREDIYIHRLSGNVNNGVISQAILVQYSNNSFGTFNANTNDLEIAKKWSKVSIDIALDDFNLDGYVDVFLKGVNKTISAAKDHIVFSHGAPFYSQAQAVKNIDDNFKKTFSAVANWIVDKDYFKNNIKTGYKWVLYPAYAWNPFTDSWQFYWVPVWIKYPYYDRDVITEDAVKIKNVLFDILKTGEIKAGSKDAKDLSKTLERVLGVDFMAEALSSEKIRLPHEDDIPLEWLPQIRLENVIEIVNDLFISGNYQTLSEPKNVSNPVNSCGGVLVCEVYNNQTGGVGRGYREGLFDKEVVKWGRYNCLCGTTPFNFVGPGKDYLRLYGVSGSHTPVREYVNPFTVNPNGYYDKWKYETFIESFKKNYQTIPNHLKP